jgi:hypothetical protein
MVRDNIGFAQVRYTLGNGIASLVSNGQAEREKDSLIDVKATTPNTERESAGNGASLGVWVVSLQQPVGIITLNAAASVSW